MCASLCMWAHPCICTQISAQTHGGKSSVEWCDMCSCGSKSSKMTWDVTVQRDTAHAHTHTHTRTRPCAKRRSKQWLKSGPKGKKVSKTTQTETVPLKFCRSLTVNIYWITHVAVWATDRKTIKHLCDYKLCILHFQWWRSGNNRSNSGWVVIHFWPLIEDFIFLFVRFQKGGQRSGSVLLEVTFAGSYMLTQRVQV